MEAYLVIQGNMIVFLFLVNKNFFSINVFINMEEKNNFDTYMTIYSDNYCGFSKGVFFLLIEKNEKHDPEWDNIFLHDWLIHYII